MGSRVKGITLCLTILLLVFFNAGTIFGASVKLESTIKFSPEGEALQDAWSFCVTDDGIFIIPDVAAGNLKLYEQNRSDSLLKLVNTIGKKGISKKGDLAEPSYCFFSKNEATFGVMDEGRRKILVYERPERTELTLSYEIPCLRLGYDIQLIGEKLVVSGFQPDQNGKPYHLYYVNVFNNQETFLLPSYYKFGLKSFDEYKSEYRGKPDIKAIGLNGFFDIQGDNIFFAWEGDLKIIKLNIKNKEISYFGKQTRYYKKPHASKELLEAHNGRDVKRMRSEREKMSFVRQIFTTPKYVVVVYTSTVNPNQINEGPFRMQVYTLNGEFLEDLAMPGYPDARMWFDKDKLILYSLANAPQANGKMEYFILQYRINGL